jgi:hypothetical protein
MLIGALAAVVAATIVTVAMASAGVAGADRRAELARAAADTGIADVLDRLAWGLAGDSAPLARTSYAVSLPGEEAYAVALTRRAPGTAWPRTYDVEVCGTHGAAQATVHAVAEVRPARLPCGVSSATRITCTARTTVRGCGLYAGADVFGRQNIGFAPSEDAGSAPGSAVADGAHGDLWPSAAVHAGGRIYSGQSEEHTAPGSNTDDTDACTGGTPPLLCTMLPSTATIADLEGHAGPTQTACPQGSLDLTTLAGPVSGGGLVVVVPAADAPLQISGWRPQPPLAPQVTLVVLGDAIVAAGPSTPSDGVAFSGELVVSGTLRIETPVLIVGSLAVGALHVDAPLVIDLPQGWRDRPPAGALSARVVAQW